MPKATVSLEPTRFELKTCPEAFVLLRQMSFGEKLTRQEKATRQTITMQKGQTEQDLDIDILQRQVAEWEFSHLVIDHNLEDDNGNKLDFKRANTLDILDPRIGDEINGYIGDMNNFEEADQKGNS